MIGQLQRWGNSLALRIPKAYLEELGWGEKTQLREMVVNGKLVLEAVTRPVYTLEELLEGIPEGSIPEEIDTGLAVGNEEW